MSHNMKMFLITSILSLLYGGGMAILFAHAVNQQQIVLQEGY